mmetsp:Transcript_17923/g.26840  ORF Transcript_17923/g.26840 Transcript_17923/m.26840 type:complete len:206 (-) Transcript_17923:100-717(-)|eukprot:CAMPEP_0167756430 /NCGR_PEP_ID=MMETSP0110_2-20121227/9382_1 /TAXON_ID=629695 /ORGANISM="Gymnochlora sp., Strain CCMP2014" /LENGTH=205 /DNA_ID=CAMNT_0007642541 /DNA_START=119 /DNA_END=736 /DNA_ORIENTATION=-
MTTPSQRRLMRDFKRLQGDPPQGVTAAPEEQNILKWNAVIFGPDDTPWEGGTFKLTLEFTEDYPNKPPKVVFITKMFHPNIYANGQICLDILQNQWSPIYDIAAILTSIQSLLTDPNPNSPANVEAAKLYQSNRREYDRKVMQFVEDSWDDDEDEGEDDDDEDMDEDDLEEKAAEKASEEKKTSSSTEKKVSVASSSSRSEEKKT